MTEENYNYRTSTITVLNGSGKIPTTTLKNSPATVLCYPRTSACIWKWRPLCSFTMYSVTVGAGPAGRPREFGSFPR